MARTIDEKLVDLALVLYLVGRAYERGCAVDGITRLQKLVFLAEREMVGRRIKGFNYTFVRFEYGPFSSELSRDHELLVRSGVISDCFEPLDRGLLLLERLRGFYDRYREVVGVVDGVVERWAGVELRELLDEVYNMVSPLDRARVIEEVRMRKPLLTKLRARRARLVVELNEVEKVWVRRLCDPDVSEYRVVGVEVGGRRYEVLLLAEAGVEGWVALVPELPGCVTQGEAVEEALENAREAIKAYLEGASLEASA